jgi:thioredoxin-dependent peroxiredoxin
MRAGCVTAGIAGPRLAWLEIACRQHAVLVHQPAIRANRQETRMGHVTLHGSPLKISGELPAIGSTAPDFNLIDTNLGERTLADFAGKRKILNISPSLDTPVCAAQARHFNEAVPELENVVLLVITADLPFAQSRFCHAENVDYVTPLSTVRSQDFGRAYGILLEEGPMAGTLVRAVVVLDENDRVIHTELVEEISAEPDYEAALAKLR